jgi:glycosyltransferase involved in cell wall biosynthesis
MKVAVILPCYNEEAAIYDVVKSFAKSLPQARICVFDNNSEDKTVSEAIRAGASIHSVGLQGKGNVVKRMFADLDADVYLMADGDGTYDAASAPKLVDTLIEQQVDMVVGVRESVGDEKTYRRGHVLGNKVLTNIVRFIFGTGFTDMLSGYRAFSKRFVKTFPIISSGFEIETEITIHALRIGAPCAEVQTPYSERIEGSTSKLSTYRDGFRILSFIGFLFREFKPFPFFGLVAIVLALLSITLATPIIFEYIETGLVPKIPTAILSTGVMIAALLSLVTGIIIASLNRGRKEALLLQYLRYPPPEIQDPE